MNLKRIINNQHAMLNSQYLGKAVFVCFVSFVVSLSAMAESRPNIVFVLADDQRYDMMSCAGNPYAQTPHLDRLAEEGIRFDRAFTTCAVCMPSRCPSPTLKTAALATDSTT